MKLLEFLMHMKTNESRFLEKLDKKSAKSGQVLKRYVVANLVFLQECVSNGYTLTAIADVISEELQHKVYPSNLGRLLSKLGNQEFNREVNGDGCNDKVVPPKPTISSDTDPDIFSVKAKPVADNKHKSDDPLGIGGLM